MTEDTSQWIWIPHWHADDEHAGFQHYKDRDPVWIKNYRWLLRDDDYLDLTVSQRGLLHGIWLAIASTGNGRLRYSLESLKRQLGLRKPFRLAHLDPLIQAGFLDIRASKGLAERYQAASPEEKRGEKKRSAREHAATNGGSPAKKENKTAPLDEDGVPIMPYQEWLDLQKSTKELS